MVQLLKLISQTREPLHLGNFAKVLQLLYFLQFSVFPSQIKTTFICHSHYSSHFGGYVPNILLFRFIEKFLSQISTLVLCSRSWKFWVNAHCSREAQSLSSLEDTHVIYYLKFYSVMWGAAGQSNYRPNVIFYCDIALTTIYEVLSCLALLYPVALVPT